MKTHLTFLKAARSPQWKFSPGGIQRPFLELLPCRGLIKQNNKNALFITSREKLCRDTFLLSIFLYNSSLLTQTTTQSVRSKLLQIRKYIYNEKRIHEKGFKTLKNHLQKARYFCMRSQVITQLFVVKILFREGYTLSISYKVKSVYYFVE